MKYQIFNYDRKKKEDTVRRLVKIKKQKYSISEQIIIYYDTIKKTEKITKILESVCFY